LLGFVGGCFWLGRHFRPHRQKLDVLAPLPVPDGARHRYSTNFAIAETHISEGGKWIDGKVVGLDWTNSVTVPGLAFGTESGLGSGKQRYDDATALLSGSWEPNQTVEATVHSQNQDDIVLEEVELRLRSSLSPHMSTGYEVLFRCLKTREAYASIVRWDGALGEFTYLVQKEGAVYGVSDGDLVKATIVGNVITAYMNGVLILQTTDSIYTSGNPGMGFWFKRSAGIRNWLHNSAGDNLDYGFSRLAAWD
jgi:hypothetical protein